MHLETKKKQISNLTKEIEDKLFKIDVYRLKFKYSKNNTETNAIGFKVVQIAIQVKMLYAQLMTIQAIPNPKFQEGSVRYKKL